MNNLNVENYNLSMLSDFELAEITGGDEGTAYNVGHFVGECILVFGAVSGLGSGFKALRRLFN